MTDSVKTGCADGMTAATGETFAKTDIEIPPGGFTLSDPRRLTDGASRRLQAKKLTVDFFAVIPAGSTMSAQALGESFVANKAKFEQAMGDSYAAAYEANTGAAPAGFTGVTASDKVEIDTGDSPGTTPGGGEPLPSPTPGGAAPSPAAEEEGDNTGMIVGIIVGVILGLGALGGLFYLYKKKKAAE